MEWKEMLEHIKAWTRDEITDAQLRELIMEFRESDPATANILLDNLVPLN